MQQLLQELLAKFAKTAPALEIKAGVVEGTFYDADGMKAIAAVPSREELTVQIPWKLSSHLLRILLVFLTRSLKKAVQVKQQQQ